MSYVNGISSVPPSAPTDLIVEDVGESWIVLSWSLIHDTEIVTQIVLVYGAIKKNITVDGNHTRVNVTDLLPRSDYLFAITAVASDGQTSPFSFPIIAATRSRVIGMYVGLDPGLPTYTVCLCIHLVWQGTVRNFYDTSIPYKGIVLFTMLIIVVFL